MTAPLRIAVCSQRLIQHPFLRRSVVSFRPLVACRIPGIVRLSSSLWELAAVAVLVFILGFYYR